MLCWPTSPWWWPMKSLKAFGKNIYIYICVCVYIYIYIYIYKDMILSSFQHWFHKKLYAHEFDPAQIVYKPQLHYVFSTFKSILCICEDDGLWRIWKNLERKIWWIYQPIPTRKLNRILIKLYRQPVSSSYN